MIGLMKMKKSEKVEKISIYLDELFPDPKCELIYHKDYELLIAVVLSTQSTDKRVNSVTPVLFKRYPNLEALKEAPLEELEQLLRPIGSYHKKALYIKEIARIIVDKYNGIMPNKRKELEELPGVGRKTVNVVLSEFYHIPAFAVDTHVERTSKRLGLARDGDNVLEVEKKLKRSFPSLEWGKRHLQFVLFGRYYCKAVKPNCEECSLHDICKYDKINKSLKEEGKG